MPVYCKCVYGTLFILYACVYEQTTYSLPIRRPASDISSAPVHYFSASSAVCPNRKCHGGSTDSASTPVCHMLFYRQMVFSVVVVSEYGAFLRPLNTALTHQLQLWRCKNFRGGFRMFFKRLICIYFPSSQLFAGFHTKNSHQRTVTLPPYVLLLCSPRNSGDVNGR